MNANWLLDYPVWNLEVFGGGFWIALIAVVHVYVAHFAVGGGLFLVLTEKKGYRENSPAILDYTRKHSRFFLLLSAVFGSLTGVGIWFVISVLSPDATSLLVRSFLFGWATEWVFFLGEIIALFVYFYFFGKMNPKDHLRVGWIYFLFAWLSLFTVNGIVAFMLTPGEWLQTGDFWDGFFNPSFWPSVCFRTAMAFMLAGLFGYVTSVRIKDEDFRETMLRYCSKWLIVPLLFLLPAGLWYVLALPADQKRMILEHSPETVRFLRIFLQISPIIFVIGLLMARKMPLYMKKALTVILVVIGLGYMGSFEWIREAGRRPWLIYGYLYSNGLKAADLEKIRERGALQSAAWAQHREISEENEIQAGREVFQFLCSSCHSVRGPMNDIVPLTADLTAFGMESLLDSMGKISSYMPPFMGNDAEKKALAAYLVKDLHGKKDEALSPAPVPEALPLEIPAFDPDKDEYVLLAWTSKGMHCVSDSERYFSFSPPGSDLYALLIRRGESPERITEKVRITYKLEKGFGNPSAHSEFWKYSNSLTGRKLADNTGVQGKRTEDEMDYDREAEVYAAKGVPVLPYKDDGGFNPYPLATVEARDMDGKLLGSTKITVPVSTEMGCTRCHGGGWGRKEQTGLSSETAENILRVHDRKNSTDLLKKAAKGSPFMCQHCHTSEDPENLNFSAAIHGFHANCLPDKGAESCALCHPGHPDGQTRAFRGIHKAVGLDCTSCHGTLEDHSLALLKAEKNAGKNCADALMKNLNPRAISSAAEILPRKPWIQQPDCLNCHVNFQAPEVMETFNLWTDSEKDLYRMRSDEAGVKCAACHGMTHALYPADNPFGKDRDNLVPLQYQNLPYPTGANKNCKVCHRKDMEEEMHHPNSLGMFRNIGNRG
ncbi:MAG: cytochrome ubiquinol oxidase subunit I [Desulfobacterales bacterium]